MTPGLRVLPCRPECRKLGARDGLLVRQIIYVEVDKRQTADRNACNPNAGWSDS